MDVSLIVPAFIAGMVTFLAPCTLPLVPGYIGFISGVSTSDFKNPHKLAKIRPKIFRNGLLYIVGFSAVFILLGTLFSLGGVALAQYRILLSRIGGFFVIFFGLYMMGVFSSRRASVLGRRIGLLRLFGSERRFHPVKMLTPGKPSSSLIFGATFAFGWTPCIGPILGSILLLASSSGTVGQGALLLAAFSFGLAVPFLLVALTVGSALDYLQKIKRFLRLIEVLGGVFLILLGYFMLTNNFAKWIGFVYRRFASIRLEERLLDYL